MLTVPGQSLAGPLLRGIRRRCRKLNLLAMLALGVTAVSGLSASEVPLDLKHVRWSIDEGAPTRVNSITQAKDGYIWIGGVEGLFRFDGVHFEEIEPPDGLPARLIVSEVFSATNGDVWVGLARNGGVAVFRGGKLTDTRMPRPSREVTDIAEGPDGSVWIARGGRSRDTIARYQDGKWEELGPGWGLPDQQVWQLLFARDGTLWIVLDYSVARLRKDATRFEVLDRQVDRRASLAEDRHGRVWLSDSHEARVLQPIAADPCPVADRTYVYPRLIGGSKIFFNSRRNLWGASWADGIFRIDNPCGTASEPGRNRILTFKAIDGLTSDQTHAIFEDREGNIWVGTELGLDMLRPASVVVEKGIPANSARGYRMTVVKDGTVYIADTERLYMIAANSSPKEIFRSNVPVGTLCSAGDDSVWLYASDRLLRFRRGTKVEEIAKPSGTNAFGCTVDGSGRLWYTALERGLYSRENGEWRKWGGRVSGVASNIVTAPNGEAAVLFRTPHGNNGGAPFLTLDDTAHTVGGIEGVLPGNADLFVSGLEGFERIRDKRRLSAATYPWLSSVNGLAQTGDGFTWTIGDAGIVRMRTADLQRALAHPGSALPRRIFGFEDGLNSFAQKSQGQQVVVGGDGRVWFLARRNVLRIDPARIRVNQIAPPVHIRSLTAGGQRFADPIKVDLAAGTHGVKIAYTGLSLSVPQRVRFRYKLEGVDEDWVDAGNQREVTYSDLGPGTYTFQLMAANNDGVWNEQGESIQFHIPPTIFETWTFRIACLIVVLLAAWQFYSMRLRSVSRRLQARLEERAAERERIARELHDTLLQGVQGLIMRFQSVADRISDKDPAKDVFNAALDRADQLLIEGRDRVRDLRLTETRPLEVVIEELAGEQPFPSTTQVNVSSDGTTRPLLPMILDEVVRIVGEALFNAALHAKARHVGVKVSYGTSRLEIAVKDDGVGIDVEGLVRAGHQGHYGLIGMHERARKIGAQLDLQSIPKAGTSIVLKIDSAIAYLPRKRLSAPRILRFLRHLLRRPQVVAR